MTLGEAIKHCEEMAEELRVQANTEHSELIRKIFPDHQKEYEDCIECAKEYEQLAEWLMQLQAIKQAFYEANDGDEFWHNVNEVLGE